MGIATYEPPYDLKQRRQALSLEYGPAEELMGAKGLVKTGLMAPTGGGSSEPERTFVGPQPEFEGFNEDVPLVACKAIVGKAIKGLNKGKRYYEWKI